MQCSRYFGFLIPDLEEGKNPRTLMAKMRKTAPVGCPFKYFPILRQSSAFGSGNSD
jgi:hypothetical protein